MFFKKSSTFSCFLSKNRFHGSCSPFLQGSCSPILQGSYHHYTTISPVLCSNIPSTFGKENAITKTNTNTNTNTITNTNTNTNTNTTPPGKDCKNSKTNESLLNIFGLTFSFSLEEELYELSSQLVKPLDLIDIVHSVLNSYGSINQKGFVPLDYEYISCNLIQEHLKSLGFNCNIGSNNNTYLLWYNFLILNLLFLVSESLNTMVNVYFDEESLEMIGDLDNLKVDLTSRLDPYLKMQLQRRGVTIIENTYTGFDTEYELLNEHKCLNTLISMQFAVQSRTLIKIPLYKTLDISYVHPLTSEITSFYKPNLYQLSGDNQNENEKDGKTLNEMNLINSCLRSTIEKMRGRFTTHDEINRKMIDGLKNVKGVYSFEDSRRDQIIFALPFSPLVTRIIYPDDGVINSVSLVNMSSAETRNFTSDSFASFCDVLSCCGVDITKLLT